MCLILMHYLDFEGVVRLAIQKGPVKSPYGSEFMKSKIGGKYLPDNTKLNAYVPTSALSLDP